MSTIAIGIDIVRCNRFRHILTTRNAAYIQRLGQRILHPRHELPLMDNSDIDKSTRVLAGSWAVKEAVYKTLDSEHQKQFQFNKWYRSYDDRGKPSVGSDLYTRNEDFLMSMSHDGDILVATVLRKNRD